MSTYELIPIDGRKSFYNKATVTIDDNGAKTLYSYGTPIIRCDDSGMKRLWDEWTFTTGRHIKAFCGLNKKQFMALPLEGEN